MNCKRNKTKQNCGTYNYAVCTKYEGEISNNSSLTAGCLNLEETTQDMYDQLDDIDEKLDMSELNNGCIIFTEPKTVISVIKDMYDKICALESTIATQAEEIETLDGKVTQLQQNICS